jgi:hypothetical protein
MTQKFSNNATTTLSAGIDDAATTIAVADASAFVALAAGEFELVTLEKEDASAREVVKVTARSGASWTVVRAQDGTSAAAWASGDKVEARVTAKTLERFVQGEPATEHQAFGTGAVSIQPSRSNYWEVAGDNGVAIGTDSAASAGGAAVGYSTYAGSNAVVAGYDSRANADGVAIGSNSNSEDDGAIAIGANARTNGIAIGENAGGEYHSGILIGKGAKAGTYSSNTIVIGNGGFLGQFRRGGHYIQGPSVYPQSYYGTEEGGTLTGAPVGLKTPMLDLGAPWDWNTNDKFSGSIVKPTSGVGTVQYRLHVPPGTTYVSGGSEPTWPGDGGSVPVDESSYPGCYWVGQDPQSGFQSEEIGDDNSIFLFTNLYFICFEGESSDTVDVTVNTIPHTMARTTSQREVFDLSPATPILRQPGRVSIDLTVTSAAPWPFRGWFLMVGHLFEGVMTY